MVRIGDTTVLCWAKGGEPAYQGFLGVCLFGQETGYRQTEVQDMLKQLAEGNAKVGGGTESVQEDHQ